VTRVYQRRGHASIRALLSLCQPSFDDLKLPCGGGLSWDRNTISGKTLRVPSDKTSSNKSCSLNTVPKSDGGLSACRKGANRDYKWMYEL
jgi:hypothetical protein